MKRIPVLCLLLMVALAIPTLSQAIEDRGEDSVDSGSILVSGWSSFDMLGINVESYDDTTTTRAGFNMGVLGGYFVIDSLAVGGRFDFGVVGTTVDVNGNDSDFTTLTFNVIPVVRYYFLPDKWFKPYVGGGMGFRLTYVTQEDLDTTTFLFGFTGGGGIAFFLVDQVSIDLGGDLDLFFGSREYNYDGTTTSDSGSDISFRLGAAISVYF